MKYSKGIMWLDDCRIPFVDEKVPRLNISYEHKTNNNFGGGDDKRHGTSTQSISEGQGRFTPNLLVCDDMLNDGSVSKSGNNKIRKSNGFNKNAYGIGIGVKEGDNNGEYGDKGTNSRYYNLDLWYDNMIDKL